MALALLAAGMGDDEESSSSSSDDEKKESNQGDDGDDGGEKKKDKKKKKKKKRPRMQKIMLHRKKEEPADVFCWMEITIQDINIPSQSWTASVEVHVFWQDFSFPGTFPDYKTNDFILDDDCVPIKLSEVWENRLGQGFEVPPTYKYLPETSTIYMMFVSKVQFVERMELHRFPLDRQFLNMEFNAWVKHGNWNWMVYNEGTAMSDDRYIDWVPKAFHKPFAVRMVYVFFFVFFLFFFELWLIIEKRSPIFTLKIDDRSRL